MAKKYNTERSAIGLPLEKVGLFLLLLSLTMLFMAFSIGYVFTRSQNTADGIHLPPIFIINSFILLASSYFMNKANKAYKDDDTEGYQKALLRTMLLTIAFMGAQGIGWIYFKPLLIGENIGNGVNYLYAISGLHFAHIIGGIPFLAVFLYNAYKKMDEPMTVLLYFSDPVKRMRLQLLTIYWHFLDGLWIFLVLFFLLNMLF
ncbi:MAG: Heme/copper-type cytochrome/quinol oxidase, subunit 3 [uncultured Aureispira sp.]|uniref:Heme/copper-type cytochrome/quinol oxidase, subunit 3 n=1 Tax=uncultured Aureispira sp. TaxID=1331704 RepID=A0A6S6SSU1_9BACT|nr:MAG: Heme/copper-type cytochrome/quinol oxidase, subunit 3 [uncultured Aureispira sp.]